MDRESPAAASTPAGGAGSCDMQTCASTKFTDEQLRLVELADLGQRLELLVYIRG